ncbi:MAG: hypothetical protein RSC27_04595 [Bacilli bacterium]
MSYYSEKYAKRQRAAREQMIQYPKKYDKVSAKGASEYVMNLSFDEKTGEVISKKLQLDRKKLKKTPNMMVTILL